MSERLSPFEHRHVHDHDDEPVIELDPAHQSLADALRWTFRLLKGAMFVMLLLYLVSGVFTIDEQEVGMRLRFGKMISVRGQPILKPGGPYFAWPFPIEQVVRVPTDDKQISLDKQFWFELLGKREQMLIDEIAAARAIPMNPERDGFLLTGDANIGHAKFTVGYKIHEPDNYIRHIGDPAALDIVEAASIVVRNVAEQAIVYTIARTPADRFQKGLMAADIDIAKKHMQTSLDNLDSGIKVLTISVHQTVFPLSVKTAFRAVTDAQSERDKLIEEAQKFRVETLGGTAGDAYEFLLDLIADYELASQSKDAHRLEELDREFNQAFDELEVETDQGTKRIGGQVALVINGGRAYRTQVVADIAARAEYFNTLLPQYRQNPSIVLNRQWQDTIQSLFKVADEIIWLPPGQVYPVFSRDPELRKKREEEQLKAVQEKARSRPIF